MRFPGKRKNKHYFPVSQRAREPFSFDVSTQGNVYVVGIDQLLVDIEVEVSYSFLKEYGLIKGQSVLLEDNKAEEIYQRIKQEGMIIGEFAGGAIGNTLHNYSVLSDDKSFLLGAITKQITVGDYAFKYICNTSAKVDMTYLRPCQGPMGRAICFITPDGERSFGISKGCMNEFDKEHVPEKIIKSASALVITAFLLRNKKEPIYEATLQAIKYAKESDVPVVLAMGTSTMIQEQKDFFLDFIEQNVSIVAMNDKEAEALSGHQDPLLAGEKMLDYADLVLITVGEKGLYLSGYVDRVAARTTRSELHSKSIPEYNMYEYSRSMRKSDCKEPIKMYTHINPYMGGPGLIQNTNGAGDAALSALLHDVSANKYHSEVVPNSPKHNFNFLTYSSISQISKYANRVSYEVLRQNSPRLAHGLPQKEDSLEESYWDA